MGLGLLVTLRLGMTSKAQTNPDTFVKVNVHIFSTVKTNQTPGPDILQPLGGHEEFYNKVFSSFFLNKVAILKSI